MWPTAPFLVSSEHRSTKLQSSSVPLKCSRTNFNIPLTWASSGWPCSSTRWKTSQRSSLKHQLQKSPGQQQSSEYMPRASCQDPWLFSSHYSCRNLVLSTMPRFNSYRICFFVLDKDATYCNTKHCETLGNSSITSHLIMSLPFLLFERWFTLPHFSQRCVQVRLSLKPFTVKCSNKPKNVFHILRTAKSWS